MTACNEESTRPGDCRGETVENVAVKHIPADYRKRFSHPKNGDCCRDEWALRCRKAPTFNEAVTIAAEARIDGVLHGHQGMVSTEKLKALADALRKEEAAIENAEDFESLLKIIHSTEVFKGEDALAVFDTALRLACRAAPSGRKCPAKIYLHRGTKTGAEKFCKESIRGTVSQRDYLEKSELIPELANSDLNECELEDVLCIYKS